MSLAMTPAERERFLSEVRVGILSIPEAGRGPLAMPVWYLYEPGGDVRIMTGRKTRKAKLLQAAGRASLCVQDAAPPYRYVSIEGAVVIETAKPERDLPPLAYRYLGPEAGERYVVDSAARREEGGDILVRIRPERWVSEDYAKRGGV